MLLLPPPNEIITRMSGGDRGIHDPLDLGIHLLGR
jgi:hypothetical protein